MNERTVLAWLRLNLAFITLAFKYCKLGEYYYSSDSETAHTMSVAFVSMLLFLCGGLFITILPWSWYRGFDRFRVCKSMLDYDITKLAEYLHQGGFDYDNMSLGMLVSFSFVTIVTSTTIMTWVIK